jgi:glucosamine--fructose-6-phosphate aminotransferase (isomerizing)
MKYTETLMFKEIAEQKEILSRLEAANKPALLKIAATFKSRRLSGITLAARGSSDNAGNYFKYLAEIYVGVPVTLAAPSVLTLYSGRLQLKNQLVLGISQSGKAEDVLAVMNNGKANGALVVAITNDQTSIMAKSADIALDLSCGNEQSVAATKTFSAEMYLLLLLTKYLSGNTALEKAQAAVLSGIAAVLSGAAGIAAVAKTLVTAEECFVLGRGLNLSAALEAALKLQETCYIRARAFPSSDFLHGPFAQLSPDSIVILLAPTGESFDGQKALLARITSETGAKTLVVADSNEIGGTLGTIQIPQGTDVESPFYNVVSLQLLTNALSIARGLSPDAPRGLKKVTITK